MTPEQCHQQRERHQAAREKTTSAERSDQEKRKLCNKARDGNR